MEMEVNLWALRKFGQSAMETDLLNHFCGEYDMNCLLGRGVNREGFNFKVAMVKTCSTWPLLNKYAL